MQSKIPGLRTNFDDVEQGWMMLIVEWESVLYILQGDFDHLDLGYNHWFWVQKDVYLSRWESLIELYKRQ
jgi:hypothetical protein